MTQVEFVAVAHEVVEHAVERDQHLQFATRQLRQVFAARRMLDCTEQLEEKGLLLAPQRQFRTEHRLQLQAVRLQPL